MNGREQNQDLGGCGCLLVVGGLIVFLVLVPFLSVIPAGMALAGAANRASGTAPLDNSGAILWPVEGGGAITDQYGWRLGPDHGKSEFHSGLDIGAPAGTPVLAVAPGRVTHASYSGNYGYLIVLHHDLPDGGTWETWYGHLQLIEVELGATVATGEQIGLVGSTGRSTGPHLHLEARINGEPVDPMTLYK